MKRTRIFSLVMVLSLLLSMIPFAAAENANVLTLDEGISLNMVYEDIADYTFTPDEDGTYFFSVDIDGGLDMWLNDVEDQITGSSDGLCYCKAELTAGETYVLNIISWWDECSATLSVAKTTPATEIYFYSDSATCYYGRDEQFDLTVEYAPHSYLDGEVTWTLVEGDCVTMSCDGMSAWFEIKSPGTAIISATTQDGMSAEFTLNVAEITDLTVDGMSSIDLAAEEELLFRFIPDADGVYYFRGSSYNMDLNIDGAESHWESNWDEDYSAVFAALTAGETYYIYLYNWSDEDLSDLALEVRTLSLAESIYLDSTALTAYVGSDYFFELVLSPTPSYVDNITWESSDSSVVQIMEDGYSNEYCIVSFLKPGEATLTAKSESGLTATCKITVKEPTAITVDKTFDYNLRPEEQAKASFTPDANGYYAFHLNFDCDAAYSMMICDSNYDFSAGFYGGSEDAFVVGPLSAGCTYNVDFWMFSDEDTAMDATLWVESIPYVTDLKITKNPEKTSYVEGTLEWYNVSLDGIELEVTWSDNTTDIVSDFDAYDFGEFSFDITTDEGENGVGSVTLTCGYGSASYNVSIIADPVESIEVVDNNFVHPENAYCYEDDGVVYYHLDPLLSNIQIKINYLDGSSTLVSPYDAVDGYYIDCSYESTAWTKGGNNEITFSYLEHSTTYSVVLGDNPVTRIEITVNSDPLVWGEDIDHDDIYLSGLKKFLDATMTVYYADGTVMDADCAVLSEDSYINGFPLWSVIEDIDEDVPSQIVLTFSYMGATAKGVYDVVTELPAVHEHSLTKVPAVAATYTAEGNKEYYTCSGCDKWFADAEGQVEITNKSSVVLPKLVQPDDDTSNKNETGSATTGDSVNYLIPAMLMAAAVVAFFVLVFTKKQRS